MFAGIISRCYLSLKISWTFECPSAQIVKRAGNMDRKWLKMCLSNKGEVQELDMKTPVSH